MVLVTAADGSYLQRFFKSTSNMTADEVCISAHLSSIYSIGIGATKKLLWRSEWLQEKADISTGYMLLFTCFSSMLTHLSMTVWRKQWLTHHRWEQRAVFLENDTEMEGAHSVAACGGDTAVTSAWPLILTVLHSATHVSVASQQSLLFVLISTQARPERSMKMLSHYLHHVLTI